MSNIIIGNMYKIEKAVEATWNFFNGKFGRKVLKQPYRRWWRIFWFVFNAYLVIRYIMFPFFEWWQPIVNKLNYIVWG